MAKSLLIARWEMTRFEILVTYIPEMSDTLSLRLEVVLSFALLLITGLLNPLIFNLGNLLFTNHSLLGLAIPGEAQAQANPASPSPIESRNITTNLYREVYCPSNRTLSNWQGDPGAGDLGSVSPEHIEAIKRRIIFYRALARVPSSVSFDPVLSTYASQAALMMSANKKISHSPDNSWLYFSPAGATAAHSSNLSLGTAGPETIDDFVADDGDANSSVGHRRWLLFPSNESFGLGLVDPRQSPYPSALALWVIPPLIKSSATAYSWPPAGYVPYSLIFQRWSFSLSEADFSEAQLTIRKDGQPQETTLEPIVPGFGDNTIVWTLVTPVVLADTELVFEISITNVRTPQNEIKDFSYTVIAYSPDTADSTGAEKILHHAESTNGAGIQLAYMASDNFGCVPQRNPDIEVLWTQLNSEPYKPFTTVGSKGKIFLPPGFSYMLRLKNSTITAGPFELGTLGVLKSPENNLVSTLTIAQPPTPMASQQLILQNTDTPTPTPTTFRPVATATLTVPSPTTLALIFAEATTNESSNLTAATRTRTPTPTAPITAIDLKIKNVQDAAEIFSWTENSIRMSTQTTQVSLFVASSPRVNGIRFRSFDTDLNGELRIKLNIKRIFRTVRSQGLRKIKRLYMKACVGQNNICSKAVLIPNGK
jgi:hypothetical protein